MMISHKNSLLRQFLLAATLATGFGTLWFVLMLWLGASNEGAWPGRKWPPREALVVGSDGTPLIESTPHANLSLATYRDLNGREHDPVDRNERLPSLSMSPAHESPGSSFSRPGWAARIKVFMDEREPTATWFFVHDGERQGSGYFVGYESVSNRRIGFIGRSGFRSHPVPANEWIPARGEVSVGFSSWSSAPISIYSGRGWVMNPDRWDLPPRLVYVPSGNRLQRVDLAARTIATVFETPGPIVSVGIPMLSSFTGGHITRERPILVRTRENFYILDHNHKVIRVFAIPTEIDRRSPADWYEIGNGQAVVDFVRPQSSGEADPENVKKQVVYRVADDGAIQESFELTLQTGSPATSKRWIDILLAVGIPAPAILLILEPIVMRTPERVQDFLTAFTALLKHSWPALAAVLAIAAVLAMLAWRRSRAFGLSRREQVAWAAFVLLLGVPGYVGFLLGRRWPVRVPCPSCHAPVARDRAACAECGALFPDPPLTGIEIFA